MSVLQGAPVRGLETYDGFAHERSRVTPADLGYLREMVRTGLRYGWSKLRSREGGAMRWLVNSAGECDSPVVAHFRGVASFLPGSQMPKAVSAYLVSTARRCRQCEWCRSMRSHHWSHRANSEYDRAARTWLGTITLSPMQHAWIDAKVAKRAHQTGASWLVDWSDKDRFRERAQVMGDLIQAWIKRFRQAETRRRRREAAVHVFAWPVFSNRSQNVRLKKAKFCVVPAKFRYLLVAEEHRSERTSTTMIGRPHYHMLIHERWPYELIRSDEYYFTRKGVVRCDDAALIRKGWGLGFTQFELCREARSASYLCKYLAKDMLWRVRASTKYGKATHDEEVKGANGSGATSSACRNARERIDIQPETGEARAPEASGAERSKCNA